jgi:hypothetical protein
MRLLIFAILIAGIQALGCSRPGLEAGSSSEAATTVAVSAVSDDTLRVYLRPDSGSVVWAELPPGETLDVLARTSRGWLGFDPGVAQAGNSGSFRLRWLAPGGAYSLQGDPEALDVVWGPSPGVAYVMTFDPLPIYFEPDSASGVIDSLRGNAAAAIIEALPGWYRIDPVDGPYPGTIPGWVSGEAASINGPLPGR